MNEPLDREVAVLNAALELSSAERGAYLEQACAGDAALRRQVEALLAAHEQAEGFLDGPSAGLNFQRNAPVNVPLTEKPGDRIGRYKLLQQIGEGGCGVVYMAEQEEPVRRRVALKVIKLGMDTKQVIARFEAERQALALMDHPNIAKVLDAGATEAGRPYFVMELVRGIKITEFCDENKLSTKERLKLFILVCQAIQHAHQKGVIHRDIKPSNILVTVNDGVPVPKVIDFGIAKATQGRLTDQTLFTAFEQFIGTPAYMSPEQAVMTSLDIDTRSDIYSLGVLLYELLTGVTPFDQKELLAAGLDAMRRTIREVEPVKPSTRLTQELVSKSEIRNQKSEIEGVSSRRLLQAKELIHLLRGDLDWIVMKCLEKDRTRRYETANGVAMDVQRHLNTEPVRARPPSAAYRLQKALRRNKLIFAAGTAVALAMIVGLGLAAVGLREAVKERDRALVARAGEEVQRRSAQQAQANETRLRREAEVHELVARRRAYASDLNLAQQSIAVNNFGRAQELLDRHRPATEFGIDLRDWEWRYLWQQCRSDAAFTLCQKPFEITALTISADGNWLAVAEHNQGGLSIWNLRTRQEIQRLEAGDGLVLAAFSPREPLLAFTGASTNKGRRYVVRLWSGVTKENVAELRLGGPARGVKFSSDGKTLVTSTVQENQIALWRIPDGKKLASFAAPQTWHDDGTLFAVAGDLSVAAHSMDDGRFRMVDLNTGRERWIGEAVDRHATALEFSPDGRMLASGAGFLNRLVRLWDVESGKEIARLEGHRGYVLSFVFWPDGKTLASASSDQTICLWDLGDPKQVPPPRILKGHQREVWRLALLADQDTLISGSQDGSVNFWRTQFARRESSHFTLPEEFKASERTWQFAPDSQSILAVTADGQVERWQGAAFERRQTWLELGRDVRGAVISEDGKVLAAGSDDGTIQVWDLPNRKLLSEVATEPGPVIPRQFLARGSRLLVHHTRKGHFAEWDLATSSRTRLLPGSYPPSDDAGVSVDERWFFVGNWEYMHLFDLKADPPTRRQWDMENLHRDVTFSPDGSLIAANSRKGYAGLWESIGLREVVTFRNFLPGVHGVRFSVGGERFLAVHGVRFSGEGKRFLTSSAGNEVIKIFDVESQQELITLPAVGSRFMLCPTSPDNNLIAASSQQGVVYVWRAPSFAEIEAAEAGEKTEMNKP